MIPQRMESQGKKEIEGKREPQEKKVIDIKGHCDRVSQKIKEKGI